MTPSWGKEAITYDLHSFNCYLYENLDLIIIFFTLLQKKIFKTIYFSKYYHCSSLPIAAICRSTWRKEFIIYVLHSFKCYLHENLDLIIIFFTLLQKKLFKTIYFSKYSLFFFSTFLIFLFFWCISNEVKSVNVWILSGFIYCGDNVVLLFMSF